MTETFAPEVNSAQWCSFKRWLEGELANNHLRLASLSATDEETQQRRGAIAFINSIFALEAHAGIIKSPKLNGR